MSTDTVDVVRTDVITWGVADPIVRGRNRQERLYRGERVPDTMPEELRRHFRDLGAIAPIDTVVAEPAPAGAAAAAPLTEAELAALGPGGLLVYLQAHPGELARIDNLEDRRPGGRRDEVDDLLDRFEAAQEQAREAADARARAIAGSSSPERAAPTDDDLAAMDAGGLAAYLAAYPDEYARVDRIEADHPGGRREEVDSLLDRFEALYGGVPPAGETPAPSSAEPPSPDTDTGPSPAGGEPVTDEAIAGMTVGDVAAHLSAHPEDVERVDRIEAQRDRRREGVDEVLSRVRRG